MPNIFLFLLACYGLCYALMNSKVSWLTTPLVGLYLGIQEHDGRHTTFFERMFACPLCTGFHCGWFLWLVGMDRYPMHVIMAAFASAGFCYIADTVTRRLEQ